MVLSLLGIVIVDVVIMQDPVLLLHPHQKTKVIFRFEFCSYAIKLTLLKSFNVCPKCANAGAWFKISSSLCIYIYMVVHLLNYNMLKMPSSY